MARRGRFLRGLIAMSTGASSILALVVVLVIVLVAAVAFGLARARGGRGAMPRGKSSGSPPRLIIVFRHCEKETKACKDASSGSGSREFPGCYISGNTPPFSRNDCSAQGYLRAQALPASMHDLLAHISRGDAVTAIYAAGSREMNSKCSHSRRMWEIATPLAAAYGVPINASYCLDQQEAAARDIMQNNPGGVVAVAWEHKSLPLLMGWLYALANDPAATAPFPFRTWPGGKVFDQYWILDLRGGAQFLEAPQRALPGDCPYPRSDNACIPIGPQGGGGLAPWAP